MTAWILMITLIGTVPAPKGFDQQLRKLASQAVSFTSLVDCRKAAAQNNMRLIGTGYRAVCFPAEAPI